MPAYGISVAGGSVPTLQLAAAAIDDLCRMLVEVSIQKISPGELKVR